MLSENVGSHWRRCRSFTLLKSAAFLFRDCVSDVDQVLNAEGTNTDFRRADKMPTLFTGQIHDIFLPGRLTHMAIGLQLNISSIFNLVLFLRLRSYHCRWENYAWMYLYTLYFLLPHIYLVSASWLILISLKTLSLVYSLDKMFGSLEWEVQ